MGILLDTSGSQQNVLPLEQQAGRGLSRRVLRSKDEAFLISFDVNVDLLSDYTNNAHALARAMDKAKINVGTEAAELGRRTGSDAHGHSPGHSAL